MKLKNNNRYFIIKVTMRTLLYLLVLPALLLVGCTDTSIVPIESDNQSYQMIKLPPKAGLSVENNFSTTKTINGDKGGVIRIKERYKTEDGHTVKIDVKLKVKKKSFPGDVDITMTIDADYAAVWFFPHMVFDKPVELQAIFEGINLENLDLGHTRFEGINLENLGSTSGDYDFVFIDEDGNIELVEHDLIDVDEHNGKIKFHGENGKAKLTHFSRYAFIR
jgi:hypothetical protein